MRISRKRATLLTFGIGLFAAVGVACADSEEATTPADTNDSGLPSADASASDSGTERDAAGPVEAGARECSTYGFCPTALPSADATLSAVWGDGTAVVWAVTAEGAILRWDGNAWHVHTEKLGALKAIWGSSATDLWVTGERGIFHGTGASSDALIFEPSALPDSAVTVSSIWGTKSDDIWAVGFTLDEDGFTTHPRAYHFTGAWTLDGVSTDDAAITAFTHVWGSPKSGLWLAGLKPQEEFSFVNEVVVLRRGAGKAAFVAEDIPEDPNDSDPWKRIQSIAGGAVSDTTGTAWLLGRSGFPGVWEATTTDDGQSFTWTYRRDGSADDPALTAITGNADDALWTVGEYGRARRLDGTTWIPTAVTTTKYPVVDPLYGVWSHGTTAVWVVGKGMALRWDPTKATPAGNNAGNGDVP